MDLGFCGVKFPPAPKIKAPSLSYQLVQMWDRRGREMIGLGNCKQSNINNRIRQFIKVNP